MPDNRAIVHFAGSFDGVQQHCVRCHRLLYDRSWDGNPWPAGMIVNHGHGGWSVLRSMDSKTERLCHAKGERHA